MNESDRHSDSEIPTPLELIGHKEIVDTMLNDFLWINVAGEPTEFIKLNQTMIAAKFGYKTPYLHVKYPEVYDHIRGILEELANFDVLYREDPKDRDEINQSGYIQQYIAKKTELEGMQKAFLARETRDVTEE